MTRSARPVVPEHGYDDSEQAVWSWLEYGDLGEGDIPAARTPRSAGSGFGSSSGVWDEFTWDLAV